MDHTVEAIRQLNREDDLSDLIALSREFFEEYSAHHRELFQIDELRDAQIADYFARSTGSAESATFVAILDGRAVGYIAAHVRAQAEFYKVKEVGAISGLMVHRDHRRKGIATRLLAEARAFFLRHGIRYFTVYTAVANQAALEFYERNGMTALHTTLIGETRSR